MSFDGAGAASGALSGAATGAAIGSVVPVIGTAVGAVVGGAIGLFSGSQKTKKPAYQPLDINKIITDARTQAADNYKNSINLEQQLRPGTAALRGTTDLALNKLANGATPGFQASNSLLASINESRVSDPNNPLLSESADRILHNLRLGGTLGADQQAVAVKAALEKGGAAGISGSGAARGLVARDLGLTSLGLENQRIGQAQTAGQAQADLQMRADALRLQDYLGRLGAANGAAGLDINRTGLLASIIDSRALPESGLSPGSVAGLYVSDNNAKNQVNATSASIDAAQKNANMNALLGFGSAALGSGIGTKKSSLVDTIAT